MLHVALSAVLDGGLRFSRPVQGTWGNLGDCASESGEAPAFTFGAYLLPVAAENRQQNSFMTQPGGK